VRYPVPGPPGLPPSGRNFVKLKRVVVAGAHQGFVHHERGVREMAGVAGPGAAGRGGLSGVLRGESSPGRRPPQGADRQVQPAAAGVRGQTTGLQAAGPTRTRPRGTCRRPPAEKLHEAVLKQCLWHD
jgi:hypothetical protein